MPELPEVESIRLGLLQRLVGRRVSNVHLARTDIIRATKTNSPSPTTPPKPTPDRLLAGCEITAIHRLGKQLALVGHIDVVANKTRNERKTACDRVICIQLGMSGSLILAHPKVNTDHHCHVIWSLDPDPTNKRRQSTSTPDNRLIFRDPRRFGGIRCFASLEELQKQHWHQLGPDALTIDSDDLHTRLQKTTRALKAALLDQHLIAGLGNIYVDELLFVCRLHPLLPANRVTAAQAGLLVNEMRPLLQKAIDAGGSTLRDHRDAAGEPGDYQHHHLVYGCADEPCSQCSRKLKHLIVAGRSTVFCPSCQKKSRNSTPTRKASASAGSPFI